MKYTIIMALFSTTGYFFKSFGIDMTGGYTLQAKLKVHYA
jgi:hypothetical protein